MTKLFGANWKTSLSGIMTALFSALAALAALPYTLGDVATLVPADLKTKVFVVSLFATVVTRIWNAILQKDKNVTGGTIEQDAKGCQIQ